MTASPIPLSVAHITDVEVQAVSRALQGGWVAPVGPEIDAFEAEVSAYVGAAGAVALASGTAALHLGLHSLGVNPGDEVLTPTLTFAATAFAVCHCAASPVFIDVEPDSWNLDPELLARTLAQKARRGSLPAAVIPVDLMGRTADYDAILPVCERYEVPVLVDSAESLGATHRGQAAGSMGDAAVFSFNGNKILTTSAGGMLVSQSVALLDKVRYWSTQARDAQPWYEHREIGFNYGMSNVLAALGRGQLSRLPEMITKRKHIRARYVEAFRDVVGVAITQDPPWGSSNAWLTTAEFDLAVHPGGPSKVREYLAARDIEARHIWKPMHQQPVFAHSEAVLSGTADRIFGRVLCLPSGVGLTDEDVDRVIASVLAAL